REDSRRRAWNLCRSGNPVQADQGQVPELARSAGIQLDERVSLRRTDEILSSVSVVLDWSTRPAGHAYPHDWGPLLFYWRGGPAHFPPSIYLWPGLIDSTEAGSWV